MATSRTETGVPHQAVAASGIPDVRRPARAAPLAWLRPLGPAVAIAVLAVWHPSDHGPTLCPFALLTGTACPGCGMTRALSSLFHGDWSAAWRFHPLAPLIALEGLVAWGWWIGIRRGRLAPPSLRFLNTAIAATAGLLVVVWLIRMASGTLPPV